MQLDQPIPPAPAGGPNPYEFILNPQTAPRSGRVFKHGLGQKERLLRALAIMFGLLLVFGIVFNVVLGHSGGNTASLISVAQTQNELIRITAKGATQADDQSLGGYMQTVNAALTTGQNQTTTYIKQHQKKVSSKLLAATKNSQTDKDLAAAAQAGTFDNAVATAVSHSLAAYQHQLSEVYKKASGKKERALLQTLYAQTVILTKDQPAL